MSVILTVDVRVEAINTANDSLNKVIYTVDG